MNGNIKIMKMNHRSFSYELTTEGHKIVAGHAVYRPNL